jgi:hypothetical protein
LSGLGIGAGDEVILGDINWVASASPITYLGANPVLVDVPPDTWCVDPVKVEAAITSRTKAIIAVHLYGNLCDMDALLAIGERYNIPVIEDAAEAKQGQFMPGSHIPILPPEHLTEVKPDFVLILRWNIMEEVKTQNASLKKVGTKFVTAVPHLAIG